MQTRLVEELPYKPIPMRNGAEKEWQNKKKTDTTTYAKITNLFKKLLLVLTCVLN